MTVDNDGSGRIDYPDFPCSATLSNEGVKGSVLTVKETILSGPCISGGLIELSRLGSNLKWEYSVGDETASAVLTLDG